MSDIVQKLWGFCHTLRHDGIDYGDYIEQLTYLLFLKMADERGIDLSRTKFRTEKNRERDRLLLAHTCREVRPGTDRSLRGRAPSARPTARASG
jgi:type I restriction-modification system DNA methylase subunit